MKTSIENFYVERESFKKLKLSSELVGVQLEKMNIECEKGMGKINFGLYKSDSDYVYNLQFKDLSILDFSLLADIGFGYNATMNLSANGRLGENELFHKGNFSLMEEGKVNPLNSFGSFEYDNATFRVNLDMLSGQAKLFASLPRKGVGKVLFN